jgi:hypothetical protein
MPTKPEKRRARRRQNGELLKLVAEIVYPYHALHLISHRGRHVFEEEVTFVEAIKQGGSDNADATCAVRKSDQSNS